MKERLTGPAGRTDKGDDTDAQRWAAHHANVAKLPVHLDSGGKQQLLFGDVEPRLPNPQSCVG